MYYYSVADLPETLQLMHDEDNAIGLTVQNRLGESWNVYGDKRALDWVDEDNKRRCVDAVQASVDEVYAAWRTKFAPDSANYKAWLYAPTLASASSHQDLAPLVLSSGARRKEVKGRRDWSFKADWWFWSTALECKHSGWWNYPITLDGGVSMLPGSSFAVASVRQRRPQVFFQGTSGSVFQSTYAHGILSDIRDATSLFEAAPWTPLAITAWNSGSNVRLFSPFAPLCELLAHLSFVSSFASTMSTQNT